MTTENPAVLGIPESLDPPVPKVIKALLDLKVQRVMQEQAAPLELLAVTVTLDQLARKVLKEIPALQVKPAMTDHKEKREPLVLVDLKVPTDNQDDQVRKAFQGPTVPRAKLVLKEAPDPSEFLVWMANLVQEETKVNLVQEVIKVQEVKMESLAAMAKMALTVTKVPRVM